MLGHAKEIVTADNYIDNHEIIADGVAELEEYMDEVLPKESENYNEEENIFDCTDFDIMSALEKISA